MASIEVKRIGDGSVREFLNSEIGTGAVVSWVTENDPSADGLVRFINQANETGNATADSLSKFPKIVEDGDLAVDSDGEMVANWDGINDGVILSPASEVDLQSNSKQTLSLKLEIGDPDNIPQHLARVNGITVYEEEGNIKVTVKDPDTDYSLDYDTRPQAVVNFKNSVYTSANYDDTSQVIERLNSSGNFETIDNSITRFDNDAAGSGVTTHDGKLWGFQESPARETIYSFSGSKQIEGHYFRSDGLKLYVTDLFPDTSVIEEYTLSAAWDVSTASKEGSISKSNINGLSFRPNGEKLYVISKSDNEIHEYTLSNPWSLGSAQLSNSVSLSSTDNPRDLYFRGDGVKLYVGDPGIGEYTSGNVREYDLNAAWDISTLSLNQSGSIGLEGENDINGLYFKGDGTSLMIAGKSDSEDYYRPHLWQYDLSTAWDVTTASKTQDFPLNAHENLGAEHVAGTLFFKDGEKFTITKHNGEILEYRLYNDWNARSANFKQKNVVEEGKSGLSAEYVTSRIDDCCFGDGGSQFYILDKRKIESYSLSSDYDLSSTRRDGEIYLSNRAFRSDALWVGTNRAYVAKDDDVLEYILHEPWDISASEYNARKDFAGSFDSIYFKPDGSKFFGINRSQRVVRELELTTPWDISSGSQIRTLSPDSNPPSAEAQLQKLNDLEFAQGGSKMYLCDPVGCRLEYDLSSPWDLSTASFQQFVDSREAGPPPKGASYQRLSPSSNTASEYLVKSYITSPSGDKAYYFTPTDCYEYDFQTDFDPSTESYNTTYGLTTGNFLLTCFFKYKGDLYAPYTDGDEGGSGGILKYNGEKFSHFLTSGKMTRVFEEDVNARGLGTDPNGIAVFEDEIYFAPVEYSDSAESRVLRYNPQDGWEQMFNFGPSSNTRVGVETYSLLAYDGDLLLMEGVGPVYRWNKKEETFIRTSKYLSSRQSQSVHTVYDKDLYLSQFCDQITYTDALTYFVEDIDLDYSSSVQRVNGEVWAAGSVGYNTGGILVKGESTCIVKDYDKQASEIDIQVAVADQYLYVDVDGNKSIKSHDLDYKTDGEVDLGLSLGSTNGDALAGVDEPYQGNISHLKWHPNITESVFQDVLSSGILEVNIQILYRTDEEVEGVGSSNFDLEDIQKLEVKVAESQGGSFAKVKELQDPSQKQINFIDSGLTTGEEYYYKTVVTPAYENVGPVESSVASAIAEYPKPSSPVVQINSATPSDVSGLISPQDPDIYFDKFELFRSLNFGGPYSKITEFTGVSGAVTWTDDTVDANENYYYKATATKTAAPIESDFSDKVSADTSNRFEETWEDYDLGKTISEISTPFSFTSGSNWLIDDEHSRVGSQSLKSEDISNGETTTATIELSPSNRRQLFIQWGADSESGYDEATLKRNGNDIKQLSGENESSKELFSVPSGTTTNIEVVYEKDSSVSDYADSAWIHHLIDASVLQASFTTNVSSNGKVTVDHSQSVGNDVDGDFNGFHVYVDGSKVTNNPQPLNGTYTTGVLESGDRGVGVTNVRADSEESSIKSKTVNVPTITVPQDLVAVQDSSAGEVYLSWNTNDTNISHYNVYRASASGGNYSEVSSSDIASKSYTDDTIQATETYYYKVSSVDNSGNESALSGEVSTGLDIASGETETLSNTTKNYVSVVVNGTLNIEGKVTLNVDSSFEVGSGGTINGNGNGFGPGSGNHADGNGPGGGYGQGGDGGIGASYGGQGGSAPDAYGTPPPTYGNSETNDIRKGSAGGNGDGNSVGGYGGGALEVLRNSDSFSTTIDGTLNFNGQDSQYDGSSFRGAGGGSGGGVYIESEITGSGSITASGGDGDSASDSGGAGGGGRIKAYSLSSNITIDVSGGDPAGGSGNPGESGTVAELNVKVPQNLSGSYDSSATQVDISWATNSPDVSHYNVYRADASGGNFVEISSSDVNQKSYTDSSVSENETYYYKVSSVLNDGTETNLSSELEVSTAPFVFQDNFESDLSKWNVQASGFEIKTNYAYEGSQSAGRTSTSSYEVEATTSFGSSQPSSASWYWRETVDQYSGALGIYNSNGDLEVSWGSDNPQWRATDGDGSRASIYGGDGYERWIKVELTNIDWGNGTYDYRVEDMSSGHVESGSRNLAHGVDAAEIKLRSLPEQGANRRYMWWDDIQLS